MRGRWRAEDLNKGAEVRGGLKEFAEAALAQAESAEARESALEPRCVVSAPNLSESRRSRKRAESIRYRVLQRSPPPRLNAAYSMHLDLTLPILAAQGHRTSGQSSGSLSGENSSPGK
eukprot:1302542-Rhodomonas_salina.1